MKIIKVLFLALIFASYSISYIANAATTTTSFLVSATVLDACLATSLPLVFGNYTPGNGDITATTTVSVNCTTNTAFTVALNRGTTTGGTIAQRLMAFGSHTLQYNIYTTAGNTVIWGDGTSSSVTQPGTGTGLLIPVVYTAYGLLPDNSTNQAASIGAYTDTITATVTY